MSAAATPIKTSPSSASGPGAGPAAGKVDVLAAWIDTNCTKEGGVFFYKGGSGKLDKQLEYARRTFPISADGRKLEANLCATFIVITIVEPKKGAAPAKISSPEAPAAAASAAPLTEAQRKNQEEYEWTLRHSDT